MQSQDNFFKLLRGHAFLPLCADGSLFPRADTKDRPSQSCSNLYVFSILNNHSSIILVTINIITILLVTRNITKHLKFTQKLWLEHGVFNVYFYENGW